MKAEGDAPELDLPEMPPTPLKPAARQIAQFHVIVAVAQVKWELQARHLNGSSGDAPDPADRRPCPAAEQIIQIHSNGLS